MIQAKCTEKIRDRNNHIIGYKLIDKDKNEVIVKSERLKEVIRSGQLDIINLTLTSDNRLIDKKPDTVSKPTTTSSSKPNINTEAVITKAKAIGYNITSLNINCKNRCYIASSPDNTKQLLIIPDDSQTLGYYNVTTFRTDCKHKCYIASSQDNTKHILLIPDDVKYLYNDDMDIFEIVHNDIFRRMVHLEGSLEVVGGKGLTSTKLMFHRCKAHSIDLSLLDTSNVKNMVGMFWSCEAQSLDLTPINTSKVKNMCSMFKRCKAQYIDLSSFNTSNETVMRWMFVECKAQLKVNDRLQAKLEKDRRTIFEYVYA